jgi:trigger factor
VLDGKNLLPDFQARLIGLSPGAEIEFDLTFPEDYQAREVAGKTAHFQVKLHGVEEAHLPEVNETFAAGFDVKEGGVASLRQALRENMERELREGIRAAVKRQVMQGLLEANVVPLPRALVEAEIELLASQLQLQTSGIDEKVQEQVQRFKTQLFEAEGSGAVGRFGCPLRGTGRGGALVRAESKRARQLARLGVGGADRGLGAGAGPAYRKGQHLRRDHDPR